jgi:uncharacterized protein YjbI with pentapeptide repeats
MNPEVTTAIIAASVSVPTLIGTLAAQYVGRRATSKQLDRTLAEQRTRALNERFATSAEQLGSAKPAVQLAGVYAMAALADEWEENRQTCVDVLCAYLRMPYEPDPGRGAPEPQRLAFQGIREVRHTVIRVITAHLREDAAIAWRGLNFDFTGVVFDGGDFYGAQFSGGRVSFTRARFSSGEIYFGAQFSGGEVYFADVTFSGGRVFFSHAQFSGGEVYFTRTGFCGGEVHFTDAGFSGGLVDFGGVRFSGGDVFFSRALFSGGRVFFRHTQFSGGTIHFVGAGFSGGTLYFRDTEFSGATVNFTSAEFSGGRVYFARTRFSGGELDFSDAKFSGGKVDFSDAEFSGGELDFINAGDWSFPPAFPWTETPLSGVKLPEKKEPSRTLAPRRAGYPCFGALKAHHVSLITLAGTGEGRDAES